MLVGTKLGAYEVIAKLGEGGMGEVYRSRDTKLNRDVAIKVLPHLFADDAERLARFTREAQTLAALNHPNIAGVHGIEESSGVRALVMELVDGEDLSTIMARGAMPVADVLPIARQIADALEAAHDAGIVHRDLKPANIKVRGDGMVKVLDFGLAKAAGPERSHGSDPSHSPTLTARATQMGMIIGTAAYMAPEQARGRPVDRRADIWAFGVIVYEMLTGRRAFEGEEISDVLASVLRQEIDWTALPADTPPAVRRLLRRCLEKDPRKRLSAIGDARLELDEPADDSVSSRPAPLATRALWRRALPLAGTAFVTAAAMLVVSTFRAPPSVVPEVVRFSLALDGVSSPRIFRSPSRTDFVFSSDGRTLVYTSPTSVGRRFLAIRRLDQQHTTTIAGSENAGGPFMSPDDKWVGFLDPSGSYIRKVPVAGGSPVIVAQASQIVSSATWLTDGTIVYGVERGGLFAVQDDAGTSRQLTTLDAAAGDTAHIWPSAVPHARAVIFVTASGDPLRSGKLAVLDVTTGRVERSDLMGTSPRVLPTGHVVYAAADGALQIAPFDAKRLRFTGPPASLPDRIGMKSSGAAAFDVGPHGRLAYSVPGVQDRTLVWVNRTGVETPAGAPPRAYYYARVSPYGARLSLDIRDQDLDVWAWDSRTLGKVTRGPANDQYGLWTPDGRYLIYRSVRDDGKTGLYRTRVDGVGDPEMIVDVTGAYPNAMTGDGKQVIFRSAVGSKGGNDLYIASIEGDRSVKPLIATEFDEYNAEISPDGRWIAFQSNRSGHDDVYVRPFPDVTAGQWPVSPGGGVKPVWVPGGHELCYLAPDDKLMSVRVNTATGFMPGTPVVLFDASPYFAQGAGRNYDISRDGTGFIMVRNPSNPDVADVIHVVLNWAGDIVARLPKGGR
jgi:serine/threonine-protein kinase